MNCEDIRKTVYIFLDGEMAETDSKDFSTHLSGCPCCSRLVEIERAVIKTVNVRSPRYHAPVSLRARITEVGRDESPADLVMGWFTRRRFAVLSAAAAMALVVLAVYYGFEGTQTAGPSGDRRGADMAQGSARATGFQSVVTSIGGNEMPMTGFGAQGRVRTGGFGIRPWHDVAGRDPGQLKLKSLRQRAEQAKARKTYLVHDGSLFIDRPEFTTAEADEGEDTRLPFQVQYGYFVHDR